jgi:hypothetical protein
MDKFGEPADLSGAVVNLPSFVKNLLIELPGRHGELVVIGAADSSEARIQRDIETVLADPHFRVFDLRGAPDIRGIGALATDIGDAVRLLLIDDKTAQRWLGRLARAFLDNKEQIVFNEGSIERPRGRSVVIVQYGATEIADVPPILREPIVQFIA